MAPQWGDFIRFALKDHSEGSVERALEGLGGRQKTREKVTAWTWWR